MKFTKYDNEKPRWDLLPVAPVREIVKVLTFGAKKYDDHNWRKCAHLSTYYAALQRHVTAFWEGEDNDPESGLSHLAHAGCCLLFMFGLYLMQPKTDNRPGRTNDVPF